MNRFKKVSLQHEEFVVCAFGQEIPISAIKTGLLGSFIIMVALVSYFVGEQMQQQTVNWFAFYSNQGLCRVMPVGGSFTVICGKQQYDNMNLTAQMAMNITDLNLTGGLNG